MKPNEPKTERVTFLTSKQFKRFLADEAKRTGKASVGELIRSRFEESPAEAELRALTNQLRKRVAEARAAVGEGLDELEAVLGELRSRRAEGDSNERRRAAV